jgi:hypothetical protein
MRCEPDPDDVVVLPVELGDQGYSEVICLRCRLRQLVAGAWGTEELAGVVIGFLDGHVDARGGLDRQAAC